MLTSVNGTPFYAYTGGKPFDPAKPTVVFIHGVLNDHSVWAMQSRFRPPRLERAGSGPARPPQKRRPGARLGRPPTSSLH